MTLRFYLMLMTIFTLICWGGFIFVLETVNPETTNWVGFFLFYSSLFLSLSGTASLFGFIARFLVLRRALAVYAVRVAFRQSFFFSFLAVAILFLLSRNLFTWLNLFFLVIGLSLLEFFLLSCGRAAKLNFGDFEKEEGEI